MTEPHARSSAATEDESPIAGIDASSPDFTAMLRARAECIRATNFVHIGERDARDFAILFEKAADEIDFHREKVRHEEQLYMDGLD